MSDKKDNGENRTDWAETRTDWAEDRTIMANERTFNSWMGLGLGSVGVAIALKAVFGDFEPTWAAKLVASLFLAIAIIIYWIARRQSQKTQKRLNGCDAEPLPSAHFTYLVIITTTATIAVGAVLWGL
ncbi:DUF202 domain-containing protein [Pseudohalocynthiibacter aestuariivivens]|uniref:DUF202 domain-containing protein n=1 Tax=Roseovarius pelagicus TaxID=2980108 RepID=A0ABY6DEN5_9RHOB|nr:MULTISPECIES: DUF202 domain-containing protein [Rhodobacterales]QIE46840.1 DUF202 domain-containing protein [Pseudohalocynthiibacter aestuariivivens]UXX84617.1 DUF202 domain-containing protein [Roseovarius pelagicus]